MFNPGDTISKVSDLRSLPVGSVVRIDNLKSQESFDVAIRKETLINDETDIRADWSIDQDEFIRSDNIVKDYPDAKITVLFVSHDEPFITK